MKKSIILFVSIFFCAVNSLWAENIYVDNTLATNCAYGNYSISKRDCSGSDGNAYRTVQAAIDSMSGGDDIFIRGGKYQEGHITIPLTKNGSSQNWSSLQSYPREWAILDGNNNCPKSEPSRGTVLGYATYDYAVGNVLEYWRFERLEITGGSTADGSNGGGFWGAGGPFHFRYCYIHYNVASRSNNPGGIKGHVWHDSIIEYCYFKNNGSVTETHHNCADINIYSDYKEDPTTVNINLSVRKNIFRYNLFVGSPVGIKYKNSQWLSLDHTGNHMTYSDYGDKIHHNIFKGQTGTSVDGRQDFIQIYNNIFDGGSQVMKTTVGEAYSNDREPFRACVYNNTLIKCRLSVYHDKDNGDNSSYDLGGVYTKLHPNVYIYNNIFENIGAVSDGHNDLNILFTYSGWDVSDIDMNTVHVKNNLFYPRETIDEVINVGDDKSDYSVSAYLAADYANTLWASSAPELHNGDDYICNSSFVSGSRTVADGGTGGDHPYLSGITIPSYVGATNPDDNAWVDGVLGLANVTTLRNAGTEDPGWIEGGGGNSPVEVPGNPGLFEGETISP